MTEGAAARVRAWWHRLVAGQTTAPPELVEKVQTVEGLLPMLRFLPGVGAELRGAHTIADLLPDDDELMAYALRAVHGWSGEMLAGDGAELGPAPTSPAPGGTPGADEADEPAELVDWLHASRARDWLLRALTVTPASSEAAAMIRQAARLLGFGEPFEDAAELRPGDVAVLRRYARADGADSP